MLLKRKGQSTVEYGLLIAVVILALIAGSLYVKRGLQGRIRESSDQVGRQFDIDNYETSWKTESSGGETKTTETRSGDTIITDTTQSETLTRSEYDKYGTAPASHY